MEYDSHLSPWPFVVSLAVLILAIGAVFAMHHIDYWLLLIGGATLLYTMFAWWKDLIKEQNNNNLPQEQTDLKMGIMLFIVSEVMLFLAFFGAYFNVAFNPGEILGNVWPPKNITTIDPFHLPYLNTLILLLSSTTVTWSYKALLKGYLKESSQALLITIILGVIFSFIQAIEYIHAPFPFKGGIYPSNFYMATGFHGFHVIVGTIFLSVCWWRLKKGELTPGSHLGFTAATWYWHFVDVVWLFLFLFVYCWR